jgi:glycine cleavage system H protein
MSTIESDRSYTTDHEWVLTDANDETIVTIGVSDYAQAQLGDVVMVELPEIGDAFDQGDVCGAVESPKSVSDIFAPVSGEVIAVNETLLDEPELVNSNPFEDGWMFKIRLADASECDALLSAEAYQALIENV